MIAAFALAAALAADPPPSAADVDCFRPKKLEVPKPHPRKAVVVAHRRLFKTEKKPPDEPNCDEAAPPSVFTFFPAAPELEPPGEFTPVPPETFAAPQMPGEREPGTDDRTGSTSVGAAFTFVSYVVPVTPAVPEPVTSYLLLAGLGALGFIRWKRA